MDICPRLFCVSVVLCRRRPYDGLISKRFMLAEINHELEQEKGLTRKAEEEYFKK
jgi:hypothetical protein